MVPKGALVPVNNSWDRLIMLLSADWFFDSWDVLGFSLTPPAKRSIQAAARQSVQEFMSEAAVYWNISFAGARLERTRVDFLQRIASSKLKPSETKSVISVAENLLTNFDDDDAQKTIFLYSALTTDLLFSPNSVAPIPDLLSADLRPILESFEEASTAASESEFERLLVSSDTSWDRCLKGLTPDLPTYLSDWLSSIVNTSLIFRAYWAKVSQRLKRTSLDHLLKWYESEAKRRGGDEFHLKNPLWMQ
jgi:hypothetical protein